MRIRSLILASVSLLAFMPSAFALNLGRCQDVDPRDGGVTILDKSYSVPTGSSPSMPLAGFGPGGRGFEKCELAPVGSGKWILGKPGFAGTSLCLAGADTLALPVTGAAYVKKLVEVDNPDIPQFQDGTVDLKDSAKAYAAAVIEAIKNHEPIPKPGPQYEVVDWNPPQDGSCS